MYIEQTKNNRDYFVSSGKIQGEQVRISNFREADTGLQEMKMGCSIFFSFIHANLYSISQIQFTCALSTHV